MKVCRWYLDCAASATTTVKHPEDGCDTDACDMHATEAREGIEPECWCPDAFRDACIPVDYCPRHGTSEQRGIDPFAAASPR